MNELIIKDVDFQGSKLKAAQDHDGKIWAAVRWICDGIGLTKGQMQNERNRIQNDMVLSKGERNLVLPTSGGNQDVLCLDLEFVPLWLAKISITPKMQRESPEVVEKLIIYQLRAKDVLSAAFIKKEFRDTSVKSEIQNLREEITQKFDKLNDDLAKALEVLFRTQHITSLPTGANLIPEDKGLPVQKSGNKDYQAWKNQVYALAEEIMKYDYRYSQNRSVLSAAYYRMRDIYGFVQSQAEKEYMYRHGLVNEKPATIDVVYDDKTYRTILVPVLQSMLKEAQSMTHEARMDRLISVLAEKWNDSSPHHCVVYRKVFKKMEADGLVCWKNRISRYQKSHCTNKVPNKKNIILESASLTRNFQKTIDELMRG